MNNFKTDLRNKSVLLKAEECATGTTEDERTFYCEGGLGCDPDPHPDPATQARNLSYTYTIRGHFKNGIRGYIQSTEIGKVLG